MKISNSPQTVTLSYYSQQANPASSHVRHHSMLIEGKKKSVRLLVAASAAVISATGDSL